MPNLAFVLQQRIFSIVAALCEIVSDANRFFSVVAHSVFQRSPRDFDLGFIHELRMPSLVSRLALFLSRCKIQTGRNCLLFSSTAWRFCWRCAAFFEHKR